MNEIGSYQNRKIIWSDYAELLHGTMPKDPWICLCTSSLKKPDFDKFDEFTRKSIQNGLLEFKGHGIYGELIHDLFDETAAIMVAIEKHPEIETMTTWHTDETLAYTFWQCFFATCLPKNTNQENLTIVCTDLDGINRTAELAEYMNRFKKGWLPEN